MIELDFGGFFEAIRAEKERCVMTTEGDIAEELEHQAVAMREMGMDRSARIAADGAAEIRRLRLANGRLRGELRDSRAAGGVMS